MGLLSQKPPPQENAPPSAKPLPTQNFPQETEPPRAQRPPLGKPPPWEREHPQEKTPLQVKASPRKGPPRKQDVGHTPRAPRGQVGGFGVSEGLQEARALVWRRAPQGGSWGVLRRYLEFCDKVEACALHTASAQAAVQISGHCLALQASLLQNAEALEEVQGEHDPALALAQLERTLIHCLESLDRSQGRSLASTFRPKWMQTRTLKHILGQVRLATAPVTAAVEAAKRRHTLTRPLTSRINDEESPGVMTPQRKLSVITQSPTIDHSLAKPSRETAEGPRTVFGAKDGRHKEQMQLLVDEAEQCLKSPESHPRALSLYITAADAGSVEAMARIGSMHRKGEGTPVDPITAFAWLERAAGSGHGGAAFEAAQMAEGGEEVPVDFCVAASYYRIAAARGILEAKTALGYLSEHGLGVSADLSEAIRYYQEAAENGDARAQNNLGKLHFDGRGVSQSYSTAFRWFSKSAAQGNLSALCNLGVCYEDGLGVAQDVAAAAKMYRQAAAQGHSSSCVNLAYMCLNHNQRAEAERLLLRAASQNSAEALLCLGALSENGPLSAALAAEANGGNQTQVSLHFYMRSADLGDSRAQYKAASLLYDLGHISQSHHLYSLSASQSNPDALVALGIMHEDGLGATVDISKAWDCYYRAAQGGSNEGAKNLRLLEQRCPELSKLGGTRDLGASRDLGATGNLGGSKDLGGTKDLGACRGLGTRRGLEGTRDLGASEASRGLGGTRDLGSTIGLGANERSEGLGSSQPVSRHLGASYRRQSTRPSKESLVRMGTSGRAPLSATWQSRDDGASSAKLDLSQTQARANELFEDEAGQASFSGRSFEEKGGLKGWQGTSYSNGLHDIAMSWPGPVRVHSDRVGLIRHFSAGAAERRSSPMGGDDSGRLWSTAPPEFFRNEEELDATDPIGSPIEHLSRKELTHLKHMRWSLVSGIYPHYYV